MKVDDIWDIFGGLMTTAVVAVVLAKANTASDLQAIGKQFTGALAAAESGGGR